MARALALGGNPSSVHRVGRLARRTLEDARGQVAELVGAAPEQIVFTSGGTESNHLALLGASRNGEFDRILVSAVEHMSVPSAAAASGVEMTVIPVDQEGQVNPRGLAETLAATEGRAIVSVMLANNETGVIQPLAELAALAREHDALVHCDGVQAAGKIPLSVGELDVDFLTLSAHKLGGPQGVGALFVRDPSTLAGIPKGGGQERGLRAGTENLAGIAGFGVAAEAAQTNLKDSERVAALRNGLEQEAMRRVPRAWIAGGGAERLGNTSCLVLPGVSSEIQVMALDLEGVMVSAGSACSSGKVTGNDVLTAMGHDEAAAGSAIRVSMGWQSSEADVSRFLDAWLEVAGRAGEDSLEQRIAVS